MELQIIYKLIVSIIALSLPFVWIFFIILCLVNIPTCIKFYKHIINSLTGWDRKKQYLFFGLFCLIIVLYAWKGSYLIMSPDDDLRVVNHSVERSNVEFFTGFSSPSLEAFVNTPTKFKNIAWSSFVSLVMRISPGERVPFYMNSVIHFLDLLLISIIILALFKDFRILIIMIPLLALNSREMEIAFRPRAIVISRFLLAYTCFSLLVFKQYQKKLIFTGAVIAAMLAVYTRPENFMIIFPVFYVLGTMPKERPVSKKSSYLLTGFLVINALMILVPLQAHYVSHNESLYNNINGPLNFFSFIKAHLEVFAHFAILFCVPLVYWIISRITIDTNKFNPGLRHFSLYYGAPFLIILISWPTLGDESRFNYLIMPVIALFASLAIIRLLSISLKKRIKYFIIFIISVLYAGLLLFQVIGTAEYKQWKNTGIIQYNIFSEVKKLTPEN
ncbi:MAG: hypothetical protein GY754_19515 [bacterium]|nr:hypothetical protein [bacterium]